MILKTITKIIGYICDKWHRHNYQALLDTRTGNFYKSSITNAVFSKEVHEIIILRLSDIASEHWSSLASSVK